MKITSTLSQGICLVALLQLAFIANSNSQGTDGIGLTLHVLVNGVGYDIVQGPCGFETATWGGGVPDDFCAQVVWGHDITPDSLCCDSVPAESLDGKIVLVRRGVCEFGKKALNVEKAGAVAMIVVNPSLLDSCAVVQMAPGSVGAQVTIPVLMFSGAAAAPIDTALTFLGQTVEICYLVPQVEKPFAAYQYATPVSQVTTLKNMGFRFFNRDSTTINDLIIKADIHEPNGNVTSVESLAPPIAPDSDTLLFLPDYTPPAVTGEFEVVYSNNKYTEPGDTLRRKFVQTDYTWALDNLEIQADGGVTIDIDFPGISKYQVSALYFSGNNGGKAQYATFGIANADSVYNPLTPLANQVLVILYDADLDNDALLDLNNNFEADLGGNIVGLSTYQMTGNEQETQLIDVPILDFFGVAGVALKPNHPYYLTLLYDGTESSSGILCSFSNTAYVDYLFFKNEAQKFIPSAPIVVGNSFSYWGDRTVITRLHSEGYTPTNSAKQPRLLSTAKYSVTPNPANDNLRLHLDLAEQNSHVRVSLISGLGRVLRSQSLQDFQSGQINFDVRDIPSGIYLMWIQSAEGQAIAKVSICH